MRDLLTGLAILLIVALSVALAAPFLINWSSWRAQIEIGLTQLTGAPVRIGGTLDLRLLPAPQLRADQVTVESPDGRLSLNARSARFELALTALLRGEFHFTEAQLDEPEVDILLGQGGEAPSPFAPVGSPESARFERIAIRNGSFTVRDVDGAAVATFTRVEFDGEADTLAGPFKGAGRVGDARRAFRFSTGAAEPGRLRVKLVVDSAGGSPRAEFDGAILAERRPDGLRFAYEGGASFAGALAGFGAEDIAWRMTGPLKADRNGAEMDQAELRLGTEERGATLAGSATAQFERGALALDLQAKQIDLDRVLAPPGRSLRPLDLVSSFTRFAGGATRSLSLSMNIRAGAVTLGAETLADLRFGFDARPGEALRLRLDSALPARSRLALDGRLEGGAAARFIGRLDASTRDGPLLAQWLSAGVAPPPALAVLDLPFRTLSLAGEGEASAVTLSLRDARIALDRTELSGVLALTAAIEGAPARVFADLKSDSLDLDGLPDLASLPSAGAGVDFGLALEARAIRVARFGQGMLDSGRISLRAQREKGRFQLERLSVANLGGAALEASGSSSAAGAQFAASLDAQRLTEFAELARRLSPGPLADLFVERAARLSPARLSASVSGTPDLSRGAGRLEGRLGATQVDAALERGPAGQEKMRVLAQAPEAAALLRQLGLEAVPLRGAGEGRIEFSGEQGQGRIEARLAGATLVFEGQADLSPLRHAAAPALSGAVSLEAANVMPLLQTLGLTPADAQARQGADLAADVTLRDDGLRLERLRGWALTTHVQGAGALTRTAEGAARVTGQATLAQASLAQIAGFVLGPPQATRANALQSAAPFGPPLANLPEGSLALRIEDFALGFGPAARDASMKLAFGPTSLAAEDFSARHPGGTLAGALTLRRNGADASVTGRMRLDLALRDASWLVGDLGLNLDFAGSGRSMAALAASLAGEGSLSLRNGALPRFAPDALSVAIGLADDGRITLDDSPLRRALDQALDRSALPLGDGVVPATLAAGTLRAGGFETAAPGVEAALSGALDLRTMGLDLRASLAMTQPPRLWSGPRPRIEVAWRGALAAPRREIELASFLNGMAARHIARETERMEALEADIRERASFNRRLKAIEFMRRREREIEAWHVEQARLAAEEERRRLEEERRRAEEERRRAEEEARRRQIEEARRKAEEERQRIEDERRRAEAERRRVEEERRRQIEEARRKAEEERQRIDDERRRVEEERRRIETERRQAEEEARRRLFEEIGRRIEDDRRREEEARRLQEEQRRRLDDEVRRASEAPLAPLPLHSQPPQRPLEPGPR